jgi:hypothetical protein
MFRLCYIRGPEGLIIELAERLRPGRRSGQPQVGPEDPLSVGGAYEQ